MKSATFEEVVSDQTSKYTKIPKEEYLPAGEYKIIDQGQQFIGGYTNRKDLINASNLPVIVFGDHTKIFKFIDFPFTIGADGTKVLSVKRELADTKYVYYFLKSLKLPVAGYSLRAREFLFPK
jgi:type I restriction enzyme S subunit